MYKGRPAYEMNEKHPDWAPSLHLGQVEDKAADNDKFQRRIRRRKSATATPSPHTPDVDEEAATTEFPRVSKQDGATHEATSHEKTAQQINPAMTRSLRNSYCSVPCCSNNKKRSPDLGFHAFPANTELRARWLSAIRRVEGPDFEILRGKTFVCSLHFTPEEKYVSSLGQNKVKNGAVPSRFQWNNWGKGESLKVQQPCNPGARKKSDQFELPVPDSSTEDSSSAMPKDHNYAFYPHPGTIEGGSGWDLPTLGWLSRLGRTVKVEDSPPEEPDGPQLCTADLRPISNGGKRAAVKTEPELECSEQQRDRDWDGNAPRSKGIGSSQTKDKKRSRCSEHISMRWLGKSFLGLFGKADDGVLDIREVSQELNVPRKRIYDLVNVLQGINAIRKTSRNFIQWSYIPDTHEELNKLVREEKMLDELIQTCTQRMHQLCKDERYAYVTYEDINKLYTLKDQTVMLIQAAPNTKLQVARSLKPQLFQIHLCSTTDPINVFLCPDELSPAGNVGQLT